jgi:hypothetical protein
MNHLFCYYLNLIKKKQEESTNKNNLTGPSNVSLTNEQESEFTINCVNKLVDKIESKIKGKCLFCFILIPCKVTRGLKNVQLEFSQAPSLYNKSRSQIPSIKCFTIDVLCLLYKARSMK